MYNKERTFNEKARSRELRNAKKRQQNTEGVHTYIHMYSMIRTIHENQPALIKPVKMQFYIN